MISRIVVIGTSGSGKTTLAKALAKKLGVKHIELDELDWDTNWTEVANELKRQCVADAIRDDGWTVDGNYSQVRDLVWARAQMIVWLDYPFAVVFSRAFRRTFRRLFKGEVLWNGNREKWSMLFSKESILLWVIQTHHLHPKRYPLLLEQPEFKHLKLVRLRTAREAEEWLKTMKPLRSREEA